MGVNDWYSLFQWFSLVAGAFAFCALVGTVFFGLRANKESSLSIAALQVQSEEARKQTEQIKSDAARTKNESDEKIAALKVEAATARERQKEAELQIASANAASKDAVAKVAIAQQSSAEASAKAEGFRLDIAKANERAAEANRVAESERLARLQLETRLADRILNQGQQTRLANVLSSLKGLTVDVIVFGDTPEIGNISGAFLRCLGAPTIHVNLMRVLGGGGGVRGVLIAVKPNSPKELINAASVAVSIMKETLEGGAGLWDFDKTPDPRKLAGTTSDPSGGLPLGEAPLRVLIGGK